MKKDLIILGGGGIASIAAWIADRRGDAEPIGLINDITPVGEYLGKKKKLQVIGTSDDVQKFLNETDALFFIGFHGMKHGEEVYKKIKSFNIPDDRLYSPIDPTSAVAYDYSDIGAGVLVGPFAQIGPDVVIGRNTVVLGNAFVGHDSEVGEFCHLATNSVVGSYVTIGDAVHVGMNSTIREKVNIGDYSLIGMGAVVLEDVEKKKIVVGNPARYLER